MECGCSLTDEGEPKIGEKPLSLPLRHKRHRDYTGT